MPGFDLTSKRSFLEVVARYGCSPWARAAANCLAIPWGDVQNERPVPDAIQMEAPHHRLEPLPGVLVLLAALGLHQLHRPREPFDCRTDPQR